MTKIEVENFEMLTKVVDFGTNNVGLFPKTTAWPDFFKALKSALTQLSALASSRISSEADLRTSRIARATAREALRRRLELADQTARALNCERFSAPVRLTDRALVHNANAFVIDAAPLKKDFVRYGMSPHFIEETAQAVQDLEHAILAYSTSRARRKSSIEEFARTMSGAMTVLQSIDALVANSLGDSAMASWVAARTVVRTPRRKPPKPTPQKPETPPVPVANAA